MSVGLQLLVTVCRQEDFSQLRRLSAELFVGEEEQRAYTYVVEHSRRYGGLPDITTVAREARVELSAAPESVAYYLDKVRNRHFHNQVVPLLQAARTAVVEQRDDRLQTLVAQLGVTARRVESREYFCNGAQLMDYVVEQYQYAHYHPGMTGVATGWTTLDEITGGYQPADLITWVARMGVGKTMVLLYQAWQAWQAGHRVLFISLEMSQKGIGDRFAGLNAGLDSGQIRRGMLSTYGQRQLVEAQQAVRADARIHFYAGQENRSVTQVDALIQEVRPEIVFIDGLYLLQPTLPVGVKKPLGFYEQVPLVVRELKHLAVLRHIPIVCTSQFNRAAGKGGRQGSMESLGYTDVIGQDSSIVLSLHPPLPPNDQLFRVVDILKGREGEIGKFQIHYRFNPPNFLETAPGEGDMEDTSGSAVTMDWAL